MSEVVSLDSLQGDTIHLSSLENHYSSNRYPPKELRIEGDEIFTDNLEVDVIRSKSGNAELKILKSSRGKNRKDAGKRAENILFEYEIDGSNLSISQYVSSPIDDRYRDQEVMISLALPVGKSVYLDESSRDIIYDIKNVSNTYDGDMMGHHWLMTERGLICTDCDWSYAQEEDQELEEEEEEE